MTSIPFSILPTLIMILTFFSYSARLKKSDAASIGNDVFRIKFDSEDKESFALFGAKYEFFLEGVVNCPEFLVHFPTLIK